MSRYVITKSTFRKRVLYFFIYALHVNAEFLVYARIVYISEVCVSYHSQVNLDRNVFVCLLLRLCVCLAIKSQNERFARECCVFLKYALHVNA